MKKIFLALLSVGLLASTTAQASTPVERKI